MHVNAILVVGVLVFKVVGKAERGRKFAPGLLVEVGIGAASIDCVVPYTGIGNPRLIVSSGRQISGNVRHEIVDAKIPAQRSHRARSPMPVTASVRPRPIVKPGPPKPRLPVTVASTLLWIRP